LKFLNLEPTLSGAFGNGFDAAALVSFLLLVLAVLIFVEALRGLARPQKIPAGR